MQVVESIKKAREKQISDDLILGEIRKQNPEKEPFFKKAEEMGASSSDILNEIIKQNSSKENLSTTAPLKESPLVPVEAPVIEKVPSEPSLIEKKPSLEISEKLSQGKTLLTKESQEREEDMRKQFLKRIEAKERGEGVAGSDFFSSVSQNIESSGEDMTANLDTTEKTKMSPSLLIVIGILFLGAFILLALNFL
jgi:hypothetical protein